MIADHETYFGRDVWALNEEGTGADTPKSVCYFLQGPNRIGTFWRRAMTPFRVLMMLTTLMTSAAAVNAQAPVYVQPPQNSAPPKPVHPLAVQAQEACAQCPLMAVHSWHVQALQQASTAWRRVRAMCSTPKEDTACCEAAHGKPAGCALGIVGSAKGAEVAQAPKACACAKACACCESCKVKKDGLAPVPTQELMMRIADMHNRVQRLSAQPAPFPMVGVPPACGSGVVQVIPVPGVRVIEVVPVVHHAKPVHLVTPDLDAVCERMHHRGDMVVLEGNVLLLCKKHAQPIRIEAQRAIVNMKDGTFTVESGTHVVPTSGFGVQRTSAIEPATLRIEGTAVPAREATSSTPNTPQQLPATFWRMNLFRSQ